MIRKTVIETATGRVKNIVSLPDNWAGRAGQWKVPQGHHLIDNEGGAPGDTWDGEKFIKRAPPFPRIDLATILMEILLGKGVITQQEIDDKRTPSSRP